MFTMINIYISYTTGDIESAILFRTCGNTACIYICSFSQNCLFYILIFSTNFPNLQQSNSKFAMIDHQHSQFIYQIFVQPPKWAIALS